jgi:hypothetical protein
MTEDQKLLTAIYVEAQETKKLLRVIAEQQAATDTRAYEELERYDETAGEGYDLEPPESYFNR